MKISPLTLLAALALRPSFCSAFVVPVPPTTSSSSSSSHVVIISPPRSASTSTTTSTSLRNKLDDDVERLFAQYDADDSGSISKGEFVAVVQKMHSSSSRREMISIGATFLGSLLVYESSDVFQSGQKAFRSRYIEDEAERSQLRYFPTALLSSDTERTIYKTLSKRGFTPENTLFGHSICSDEVNNRKEQLIPLLVNRWREGFALGGLGGLPFAGKSGFGAYLHHVPDGGRLLVLFAPHVGIGPRGRVGALQRDGQVNVSSACGAAVGAYKALQKKKTLASASGSTGSSSPVAVDSNSVLDIVRDDVQFDPQLEKIVELLARRLEGIEKSEDSIAFVSYQMYGIIRDLIIEDCIAQNADLFDNASEIAVVGGVMINRRLGGDCFQPLSFETVRKGDDGPTDLFGEAFGNKPELEQILGSKEAVERLYKSCLYTSLNGGKKK